MSQAKKREKKPQNNQWMKFNLKEEKQSGHRLLKLEI